MNLVLLQETDFSQADQVQLQDRRADHIRDIHRAKVGDSVRIGMLNGLTGMGVITGLNQQSVEIETGPLDQPPPPVSPITLVLALARPKQMRRIFRSVAEFGIKHLIVINSWRVEKSYWQSPLLEQTAIDDYFYQGLEQARDTVMPIIEFKRLFKPFVEDELPGLLEGSTGLVAHPGSDDPCPLTASGPITLAVGPEGGFIPYEVEKLCSAGMSPIHLGPRILRVENAVSALSARLGGTL
ncbi:MAG: 16S rRNA (uracil(1498)-N(3))-methyltransferase [Pseudomonadales bacterium]